MKIEGLVNQMSKEYEKIRAQLAKKHNEEIRELEAQRDEARANEREMASKLVLIEKENKELKTIHEQLVGQLQELTGKTPEEIEALINARISSKQAADAFITITSLTGSIGSIYSL